MGWPAFHLYKLWAPLSSRPRFPLASAGASSLFTAQAGKLLASWVGAPGRQGLS